MTVAGPLGLYLKQRIECCSIGCKNRMLAGPDETFMRCSKCSPTGLPCKNEVFKQWRSRCHQNQKKKSK